MSDEWTATGLHVPTLQRVAAALEQRLTHLADWSVRHVHPARTEPGPMDGWLAQLETIAADLRSAPDARFPASEDT